MWARKAFPRYRGQKIDYIHNNAIGAGFVVHAEDWKYSSAKNFLGDHTVLEIDDIGFMV